MSKASVRIDSFSLNQDETILYAGNSSGEILIIDIDQWKIVNRYQANYGMIVALTVHEQLPYLATLGMDHSVVLFEITNNNTLRKIDSFSFRNVKAWNDDTTYKPNRTEAQPIAFHPFEKKIATKNMSGAIIEFGFSNDQLEMLHCTDLNIGKELITVRYHSNGTLLSGYCGKVILSDSKKILNQWDFPDFNVHWFEPVNRNTYLVASDNFCVFKLNLDGEFELFSGNKITIDDLEHVTYNTVSGRAFVAGFDRNIYEIDPETCNLERIVFNAPYKMRWIKTLKRSPDILLIQCRNGELLKTTLSDQKIISRIKETPDAIWTADRLSDGALVLSGEGSNIYILKWEDTVDAQSRIPKYTICVGNEIKGDHSYTKRLVVGENDHVYLGRTNGHLLVFDGTEVSLLQEFKTAIRDIALSDGNSIFVAVEQGIVYNIAIGTGEVLWKVGSDQDTPFWSIAYNGAKQLLAVGESRGDIRIVNSLTGAPVFTFINEGARPKRMKWLDESTLVYNNIDGIKIIDITKWEVKELVEGLGNTIEDFIFDYENNYLLLISYTCQIFLCDLSTGTVIDSLYEQSDYSKGLTWLYRTPVERQYPLDFMTYGRAGQCKLYRIHNEAIVPLDTVIDMP